MNEWKKSNWFQIWLDLARKKAADGNPPAVNCQSAQPDGKSQAKDNPAPVAR
jgi:hypothetical protein